MMKIEGENMMKIEACTVLIRTMLFQSVKLYAISS